MSYTVVKGKFLPVTCCESILICMSSFERVNKVETIFFENAHYDSKRNASQTPIIHVT